MDLKKRRKVEDAAFIEAGPWPGVLLHLKTQPWVEPQQFGYMVSEDRLSVRIIDLDMRTLGVEHFPSIEELVEKWSVD